MLSSQDITKIRKDTPGCSDKLFFNSAGSSLPVREVVDRQINYLQEEALFGGYKTMAKYASEAAEAYVEAAKLLGCEPHQVAFCESATVAYYRVISTMRFEMGDVILTSELDYISNFIVFDQLRRKHNISLAFLKKDVDGSFDLEAVRNQFTELHPKMVAVTHVPTSSGVVQDVIAIGKLCNEFEVLYLVDGCQSVGQLEVDVKAIGCDFLSCTGRKFLRGPRGTGFLYVSDRALTMNLVPISADGDTTIWQSADEFEYGNTAKKFETFERSYSNLLGFGAALKYLNGVGIKNIEAYNTTLGNHLRNGIKSKTEILLMDHGSKLSNIITLYHPNFQLEKVTSQLDEHQIYYSIARKSMAFLDFAQKGVDWAIRLSPHYFNTIEELDEAIDILATMH